MLLVNLQLQLDIGFNKQKIKIKKRLYFILQPLFYDNYFMNSFKLFKLAKKLFFCTLFLPFVSSIALLCNLKKTSISHKITNFRFNPKSLNEFYAKLV